LPISASYALILGLVVQVYLAFNSAFDADWRDWDLAERKTCPASRVLPVFRGRTSTANNPLRPSPLLGGSNPLPDVGQFALYRGKVFG
jgi:hypothetical protein